MAQEKHWMAVYDIRDAKRLAKVEKCVTSFGWRLQNSVYEILGDEKAVADMEAMLLRIIDEEEDFVLIFEVCERDWQKRELYGKAGAENPMTDPYIIL